MQFPRRYPLKDVVVLLAVIGVAVGILVHNCAQRQASQSLRIEDIQISNYAEQYVEVSFRITNLTDSEQEYRLLLTLYADDGQVLASSLFMVTVAAGKSEQRSKLLDRLNRRLKPGEKPDKATIELYKRRIL
ncbi:MAG: hypothetical protein FJ042_01065 [Candidatus Cloacimonetes bacterium]|nr:hypothetical protein [Candidatus Cloacimonadota bacterium]